MASTLTDRPPPGCPPEQRVRIQAVRGFVRLADVAGAVLATGDGAREVRDADADVRA
ncbi:hypothetical protein [Longispora urticae]